MKKWMLPLVGVVVLLLILWITEAPTVQKPPEMPDAEMVSPVPVLAVKDEPVQEIPHPEAVVMDEAVEIQVADQNMPQDHFSPSMRSLVQGIQAGTPVRVTVGGQETTYLFRSKNVTTEDFQISSGPTSTFPSSFEVFEGRQILEDGGLLHKATLAVVNDTVSMAYTTDEGNFLLERDDETGELVSRMLSSNDPDSKLGAFLCAEIDGKAGTRMISDEPPPPPVAASLVLASDEKNGEPEKEGAQVSHPYFRLGPQYDASLKTIRILMVSGSTQTGSSSNLSSRAASYFTYAALSADIYERQLGFNYQLQELVLIANDSGEPDIEPIPNDPNDDGDDDLAAARNWGATYRPQATHKWGHLVSWINVDNAPNGTVGWAYVGSYGSSTNGISVNERAFDWRVHIHELGHNVGANHTNGGAMNGSISGSESFFTENESSGGFTAAKQIYDYMSGGVNLVSGPAPLRHPEEMPFANDDSVSTPTDTAVVFNPLTNDDAATLFGATNSLSLVEVGQVYPKAAGSASISGDEITFTPVGGYTGRVWFTYTVGGDIGNFGRGWLHSADVVVTVGGNGSDPSLNPTLSTTDDYADALMSSDVRINPLLNDEGKGRLWAGGVDALSDVDGSAESYSDGAFFLVSALVVTGNGSVSLETVEMNRNAAASTGSTGYVIYTPGSNEPALVEIQYTVEDEDGNQATGMIYLTNIDSDADGLPDDWELSFFGNLNQGANDDPDGDGLTNLTEYNSGSNPTFDNTILWEPLDTNPNWSTDALWDFGDPAGSDEGFGGPDPDTGYNSSTNVYGYNLNGAYTDNMSPAYLTTTAIDCSGYENITLSFQRWLGVEQNQFDNASIEVSNGTSGWVEVWRNGGTNFFDSDWVEVSYDISGVARDQAAVQVRWVMGATDTSVTFCGWNIDDIRITGDPLLPKITLVATDADAAEEAQDPGVWTLTRDGDLTDPLTVFFTLGGNATLTDDYTVTNQNSVTIPAAQASATVTLTPVDDSVPLEIESASMTLSMDNAYTIVTIDPVAIVITDNDNNPPEANAGINQIVALTAGPPWSPGDINPAAWYDASDLTTITESGGAVSQWRDKSTNGVHLNQSNTSRQPQLGGNQINGVNAVKFDGSDDNLVTGSNPFSPAVQDAFVMAVHRRDANSSGTLFSLSGSTSNSSRWQAHAPWSDGNLYFDNGGTGGVNRVSTSYDVSVGTEVLVSFYGSTSANVQQVHKNGSLLTEDTSGHSIGTSGNIFVGSGSNTQYQNTTIAEMVIINGTVSEENRVLLEGYLAHKWGQQGNLPGDHLYKDAPPGGSGVAVNLDGTVSDPDGGTPTVLWTQVSGPGTVDFDDDTAVDTTVTIPLAGTYVLRLTVSDGIAQVSSDVTITVFDDVDGDGIDDVWETSVLGTTDGDGTGDEDANGITDFFQFLYGPLSGSYPGFSLVVAPAPSANGVTYSWDLQSDFSLGTHYLLEVSTDLSGWIPLVMDPEDTLLETQDVPNNKTQYDLTLDDDLGSPVYLRLRTP